MKTNWKAIGIVAVSAALLYYPALRLYRYMAKRRAAGSDDGTHLMKAFVPAFRGKHKPHHRHSHNGHSGTDKV